MIPTPATSFHLSSKFFVVTRILDQETVVDELHDIAMLYAGLSFVGIFSICFSTLSALAFAWFTDIKGFTAMSASMPAEGVFVSAAAFERNSSPFRSAELIQVLDELYKRIDAHLTHFNLWKV